MNRNRRRPYNRHLYNRQSGIPDRTFWRKPESRLAGSVIVVGDMTLDSGLRRNDGWGVLQ